MKRREHPDAAPLSEREAIRIDTEAVRARVAREPRAVHVGHTPLVIDAAAAYAWLLQLAEERALPRSPWQA